MSKQIGALEGKTVAIAGAGPAGLTLACLLQQHGAQVHVYERDAGPEARSQGGCLDLHTDSGQRALRAAGLMDAFRAVYRLEGQAFKMLDSQGAVLMANPVRPGDESRPEVDRGVLRQLLLAPLKPGTVVWDRQLESVSAEEAHEGAEPPQSARHRLRFKQGADVVADLVVGCDGWESKVRPLITDIPCFYTGVTLVELRVLEPDARFPELSRLVGSGSLLALGGGKTIWAQRLGDGSVLAYFSLKVPEDWADASGLDFARPEEVRARLAELFSTWAPELLALLQHAEPSFRPWKLHAFPPDQRWTTRPGLVVIGDAAHVMPPFTGEGANLAMLDAVELAEALTDPGAESLTGAVARFEAGMLARSGEAIALTLARQASSFADDAPAGMRRGGPPAHGAG